MIERTFLIHALSPLHAGTGQAVDIIDLPIARMRANGIPFLPGSTIKGVLRDACTPPGAAGHGRELRDEPDEQPAGNKAKPDKLDAATLEKLANVFAVFGPDTDSAADHAGALVLGDARLLAMPVRTFRGTFAWVSSPLLLNLARRDWGSSAPGIPEVPSKGDKSGPTALVGTLKGDTASLNVHSSKLYLEDLDLAVAENPLVHQWAQLLATQLFEPADQPMFSRRFTVVDDEVMTFLYETCTQVDTRVRLDEKTRTAVDKALWTEESLPPETILIGVAAADRSRRARHKELKPEEVLDLAFGQTRTLQFGGKASVGRGRCRIQLVREGK